MDTRQAGNNAPQEEQQALPVRFAIVVSQDKMTAYLRILSKKPGQILEKDKVYEAIAQKNVTFGLLNEEIDAFCADDHDKKEVIIAKGTRPQKGEKGDITFHFQTEFSGRPKEREDGSVDYKDLDLVQNVSQGDLLCSIVLPTDGIDGIDVFGAPVKAPKGDMPRIPAGNVQLSEDGTQLTAAVSGGIHYKNGRITIDEVYTVRGDVGLSTGNIKFNGSVVVSGNVLEGFEVHATSDITVKGSVSGAKLFADGSIFISGGISGMGKCEIHAKGNVTSSFIENAKITCGENLYADVVLNGDVKAGNAIVLNGKKGSMIGGRYVAGNFILVKNIGNDSHILQDVIIDPSWWEIRQMQENETKEDPALTKQRLLGEKKTLLKQLDKIAQDTLLAGKKDEYGNSILGAQDKAKIMKALLFQKTAVNSQIAEIDKQVAKIDSIWKDRHFSIICKGDVFPGARLTIAGAGKRFERKQQNLKFTEEKGEVVSGLILPHETDLR